MALAEHMAAVVTRAQMQLQDGAQVRQVLEELFRTAFAMGVRDGKTTRTAPPPQSVRQYVSAAEQASADGWAWGPPHALNIRAGQYFQYGGTDPRKPVCLRQVMAAGSAPDLRLEFTDTGERVRMPVMFWARIGRGE